jgi:hypothetical protein
MKSALNVTEELMRTLIRQIGLSSTMTALHNAMIHGDIIVETVGYVEDEPLEAWFSAIEEAMKQAHKMDN